MGGVGLLMGRKVGKYFAIAEAGLDVSGGADHPRDRVGGDERHVLVVNNVGFIVDTVLSLAVAGLITFLLLNKDGTRR